MFYREAGQFKTSYNADQALFPILQDKIGIVLILLVGFVVVPLTASDFVIDSFLTPILILSLAAIGLNLLTGLSFFSGHPDQYAYNSAFHWKLVFMTLAAINVAAFYTTAYKELRQLPPQAPAPRLSRALTAVSLCCWVGVLSCGRLLTFYRPPFFH